MKTTCLGILVWTLLLPALAIETNDELQDEGSDVPKQSRIKREFILADEIYVDDLDQAATDALGEIVVKRVLHSPIARASYYPRGKNVFHEYQDELEGASWENDTPDDGEEEVETSVRRGASGNELRNSPNAKRSRSSGRSIVYEEAEEPVTDYRDRSRMYVVDEDRSSPRERSRGDDESITSGRRSSTNKRRSSQQQRSIGTREEGSDGATPPTSQRRLRSTAALSEETVTMDCITTDDRRREICVPRYEEASRTAAKNRWVPVRLSRGNGASEANRKSTLSRSNGASEGNRKSTLARSNGASEGNRKSTLARSNGPSEGNRGSTSRRVVTLAGNNESTGDNRRSTSTRSGRLSQSNRAAQDNRFSSSQTQNRGETVILSELQEDDEGSSGFEEDVQEVEEEQVEDEEGEQGEVEENPEKEVEAYKRGVDRAYSNNIAFYCNCGYSGDQSSHVCQNSSNSTNSSSGTGTPVGGTPTTQVKTIVIMKKYPRKTSKRSIWSDTNGRNVAEDGKDQQVVDGDVEEDEEEEQESQTETNARREDSNSRKRSKTVVYITERSRAQETSPRGDRGDESAQPENTNLRDEEGDVSGDDYRFVRVWKTGAGGKCSCGLKQKPGGRWERIYVRGGPQKYINVRKGTSNDKQTRYVVVKEREVEEEEVEGDEEGGEEEREGGQENSQEGGRRAADEDNYDDDYEGEEDSLDNSDQKIIYVKTKRGQGSAKIYKAAKEYSEDDYEYPDEGEEDYEGLDGCGCEKVVRVRTAREAHNEAQENTAADRREAVNNPERVEARYSGNQQPAAS